MAAPAVKAKSSTGEYDESKLRETHELYDKYKDEWQFLNAAYEGVQALIAYGAIVRHERESEDNYQRRIDEAYGFSYSKSIIDIFNSYLFKKEYPKQMPDVLANDDLWTMFQEDCDLIGTEFDEFFITQQRQASIQGHIGILVDKANVNLENREDALEEGVYPYLAAYKPTAILDWRWERDEFGRPTLMELKVLDDDDRYRIWTPDTWEIWEIIEAEGASGEVSKAAYQQDSPSTDLGRAAKLVDEGENPLGEIPFIWLYNQRSTIDKEVGVSDITDVSRIDTSIIRNMSQIEEIINYAAFPMMRKPMEETDPDKKDEVGVVAILEFNPEHPESKPDWLEAAVEGPITAVLEVIAKKITEIYRSTNVGGMAATEIQTQAKSGAALKTEFQLLNSKLVQKGGNVVKAMKQCIKYWLMWEQQESTFDDVIIEKIKTYEIEDLASDLENILTSTAIVNLSDTFKKEIQKLTVRLIMPGIEDDVLAEIEKEIDEQEDLSKILEDLQIRKGIEFVEGGGDLDEEEEEEEEEEVQAA